MKQVGLAIVAGIAVLLAVTPGLAVRPVVARGSVPARGQAAQLQRVAPLSQGSPSPAWYRQYPPSPGSPVTIACPDARVCYAAGTEGSVVRTSDGGTTWQRSQAPVASGGAIRAVACESITICLALADIPAAGGALHTILLATADGGQTWKTQHTIAFGGAGGLACPSGGECYALIRGSLAGVQSDGRGWRNIDLPLPTSSMVADGVSCPAPKTCYVDAHENRGDGYGAVLSTSDGGLTWQTHVIEPADTHGYFMGIACPDAQTCYVVSNGSTSGVLVTHDAWHSETYHAVGVSLPPPSGPENAYFTQPACPDDTTCYLRSTVGTVAVTADGGLTWHQFTLQRQDVPTVFAYLIPPGVSGMACPAPRQCVAVLPNGNLVRTVNGWAAGSTVFTGTARTLTSVACTGALTCFALGPDRTLLATSNGASWSRRPYPLSSGARLLVAVSCSGSSFCLAAGYGGEVAWTGNGGGSWRHTTLSVPGDDQVYLRAVSCPRTSTCYVGGYAYASSKPGSGSSILFRTTTGGAAWARVRMPGNATVNAIACMSAAICLVGGGNASDDDSYPAGSLLLTRDGGTTWRHIGSEAYFGLVCMASVCEVVGQSASRAPLVLRVSLDGKVLGHWQDSSPSYFRQSLNSVGCLDARICFAVGDGGITARTSDGLHWTAASLPIAQLTALACPGKGRCYATGSNSTILSMLPTAARTPLPTATPPSMSGGGPAPAPTPLPTALATPTEVPAGQGCPPGCVPGMVLYRADWSKGFDGWTVPGGGHGRWQVKDGALLSPSITYQNAGTPILPPFQPGAHGVADYAVQFQARGVQSDVDFHVSVRRDGERYDDIAVASCCTNNTSLSIIYRDESASGRGFDSIIGEATLPPLSSGWHTFRVEAQGESLRLLVDGRVLIRGLDRHLLAGGTVDLSGQDAPLTFRNFEIVAL